MQMIYKVKKGFTAGYRATILLMMSERHNISLVFNHVSFYPQQIVHG